jgi:hypothetical protein
MIKFIVYLIGTVLIVQVINIDTVWNLSRIITHVAAVLLFFYFWSIGKKLHNNCKDGK